VKIPRGLPRGGFNPAEKEKGLQRCLHGILQAFVYS
jgi:hypothetical protein